MDRPRPYRFFFRGLFCGAGLAETGEKAAAGFFQGFPVSTSGSRTAVAQQAGAKTQLTGLIGAAAILAVSTLGAQVSFDRILRGDTEMQDWLTYSGSVSGQRHSALTQITPENVKNLEQQWVFQVRSLEKFEATPLVVDGVMYTSGGANQRSVTAIDARSGRQIWRWMRQQKTRNPGETDVVNRGVAISGQRVFVGTGDAFLICLDARTGSELWEVQIGDTMEGFNVTSPPLIVKDKILIGHAGAEYALRGYLDAYDIHGNRLWRFYTIPAPGEPANDTWKGDSWKTGGGSTWLTGTYDPESNTVYWPIANPAAMTDRSVRGEGDNLYTDSVVALEAARPAPACRPGAARGLLLREPPLNREPRRRP